MQRKWMYLLSALIFLTLTVGCTVTFEDGPWGSYTLSGEVTSADRSQGIQGVTIGFSDTYSTETTDFNGGWSRGFNGGDLTIRAERRGFIFEPDAYRLYDLDRSRYDLDFTVTGFIDDFTYTDTGWDGPSGYTNQEYQIFINNDFESITTLAPIVMGRNYTVKVRSQIISGSGYYGLAFNWISWSSYYHVFRIIPDQNRYQLLQDNGGAETILIDDTSMAILNGPANLLQVEQKGDRIYLSVNGTLLENGFSISAHSGYNYLAAALYAYNDGSDPNPTDARFDDFEVHAALINDASLMTARNLTGFSTTHIETEKD